MNMTVIRPRLMRLAQQKGYLAVSLAKAAAAMHPELSIGHQYVRNIFIAISEQTGPVTDRQTSSALWMP